jgi:hypothetical protein
MMHLLRLTFRFQLSSGKTILSAAFGVKFESAIAFHKYSQLFIGAHDESLSVTVRVNDPDVGADAFDSYR